MATEKVILGVTMITLQEICRYLDSLLSTSLFIADYCPNGLQVEGSPEVRSIATAVTASLATIDLAQQQGVDLLLVHHGLFWSGDSYAIQGVKRLKLKRLLDNQISLLAYHLPLDAHQTYGNNWRAAAEMGWTDLRPLHIKGAPLGVLGRVDRLDRTELQRRLEAYYDHPAQVALGGQDIVESLALISGGAHRYLPEVLAAGADCFVTGSFDEPVWHQAHENNLNFFAMGHAATEKIGPKAIGLQLSKHFDLPWQFIDDPNPF